MTDRETFFRHLRATLIVTSVLAVAIALWFFRGLFVIFAVALALGVSSVIWPAHAHDIYTGVRGRDGQLCCGGDDCAATVYRENGGRFEFLTRDKQWVAIPADRITFLPVPGDSALSSDDSHRAHLCYRAATDYDRSGPAGGNVFDGIFLYCAFIPPGAI